MAAEKESHIGDRLRYIPMGFFNDQQPRKYHSSCYYYTFGCGKQCASRCLVIVIGGFLNTLAFCLALFVIDVRLE